MSNSHTPKDLDDLQTLVICHAPDEWSTPDVAAACVGLMNNALLWSLGWGKDWSPIWPQDEADWMAMRRCGVMGTHATTSVKTDTTLARQLFEATQALCHGTPADGPLPANKYMVTRHLNHVTVPGPKIGDLAPYDALLLAVWLIALADPTLSDAVPMLLKVATR